MIIIIIMSVVRRVIRLRKGTTGDNFLFLQETMADGKLLTGVPEGTGTKVGK